MAYKFQLGTSKLSGSITPTDDEAFDLGASGREFKDLYIDGTAYLDAINFNGTAISATAAELNKLDGADADVTATKLNTLCDLSNAEIAFIDGASSANNTASKAVILDGSGDLTLPGNLTVQGTTTQVDTTNLQVKDKNILINDGGGAASGDGAGLDIEENGSVAGFIKVSGSRGEWHLKAPNSSTLTIDMDADGEIEFGAAKKLTVAGNFNIDADISSTAAEINLVDGSSAGTIVNSKAVIYGSSGEVNATTLQIGGNSITATAAEINVLDGLAQGSILLGDGSGAAAITDIKTSGQILVGNGTTAASVAVSGDITLAANGTVTINNDAVESGMLNDNVISGQTDIGAGIEATDEILISDNGTLRRTDVSRLKTYIQAGVNVYKLSGSGTIDGIIAATSGSGFYYNAAVEDENGLGYESKYMISGSNWTVGAEVKIKTPELDSGGKISIFAQSSSLGDFIHSIDGIQSDTSGSNMSQLGTAADDIPAIVLESNNAAVTLVLYDDGTDGGTINYQWAIM